MTDVEQLGFDLLCRHCGSGIVEITRCGKLVWVHVPTETRNTASEFCEPNRATP